MSLQAYQKWTQRQPSIKVDDFVLIRNELFYNQPISDDRINGERDDAALEDSIPGRRQSNIMEPAEQYRSTAPCILLQLPNRN